MEIPKYFLKMILRKTYKLAQPKLIAILPKIAIKSEPKLTENDALTSAPAITVPNKYVTHIHAIENAPTSDFDII